MIPVIVVTWNEKAKKVKVEGSFNQVFAVAVGDTEKEALDNWRKEIGYFGEVKK